MSGTIIAGGTEIELEKELTCAICTDVLYQPLTLLDCLHTFCGSCLKVWFQSQAARSHDSRSSPYTCPSCRKSVRATSSDARVNTLLEVLLLKYPDKDKSSEEKQELAAKYTKGEDVIPRRRERRRDDLDAADRRMVDEVRDMSLRDTGSRDNRQGYERGVRHRQRSRERRRGEDRSRSSADSQSHARHIEHQSSLRSLISTDELDSSEMVEEILRQISNEGLLEGIDIHNLNATQEDELSERIAEAYRQRHGRGRGSSSSRNASSRGDAPSPGRATRSRASTSRQSSGSRASTTRAVEPHPEPSAASRRHARSLSATEDSRVNNPPVSRPHLLDAEAALAPNRRRRSNEGRRQTSPNPRTTPVAQQAARSATDLSTRSTTNASEHRPSLDLTNRRNTDTRSRRQSDATDRPRSSGVVDDSPRGSTLSIVSAVSGSSSGTSPRRTNGHRLPAIETSRSHPGSSETTPRTAEFNQVSPPSPRTMPLDRPQQERPKVYKEPVITCDRCGKTHIEYDLHEHCSICKDGSFNLCHRCYREDKGCLHWFGFGNLAWYRYQRGVSHQDPPHALVGHRYARPRPGSSQPGADTNIVTTEDPSKRFQAGAFCSICHTFADDCFWKCDYCNEGEWGFCNTCVNTGRCCTHPLLPLTNVTTVKALTSFTTSHPEATLAPITSPSMVQTYPPTNLNSPTQYRPLTFSTNCNVCHYPIQPSQSRYHCYTCSGGDYDVCNTCYSKLVDSGRISRENGDKGWRRCPKDHRMIKVWFEDSPFGQRRVIVNDLVGGLFLEDDQKPGEWSWVEGGQKRTKSLSQRMFDENNAPEPAESILLQKFPPDGGVGLHVVATHPWLPQSGATDELDFPRGAEIREGWEISKDWLIGSYAGAKGLFPSNYVTILGQVTM